MTSRIGSPDTDADRQLRELLGQNPTHSFIMVSGAGSGKTTSLVKALAHLEKARGAGMRKRGQQIACITFTQVAAGEIRGDVGDTKLFHVSTIHSFLWTVVHSFQSDLREWVAERINEKIAEAQERIDRPRTHEATRISLRAEIARYVNQLIRLPAVSRFNYGTGSNYADGLLGHDDVLRVGTTLIERYPLLRSVIARRFPFIFVDESQDTNPDVVSALKKIAQEPLAELCVGFFGDPMQKIYLAGAGAIEPEEGWLQIRKPESFRCPISVLNAINNIRAEDDRLVQIPAQRIGPDGPIETPIGTAKLFIIQAGRDRNRRLAQVRRWMAENNADPLWTSEEQGSIKLLVLVHRMAASRLGFPSLYAALNDHDASNLKDGLLDGTAWVLRPFLMYLLPLIASARAGKEFEVMSQLRANCPLLLRERLVGQNVPEVLALLHDDVETLTPMLSEESTASIGDVLRFVHERRLVDLDERFRLYLQDGAINLLAANRVADDRDNAEEESLLAFLAVSARELLGYRRYIQDQSPFSTQQGVKGAEFQRVLTVLDDEESDYRLFSYGKYWGIEPLSSNDKAHIAANEDSVLDRTRRLFYVCCSRALKDLAVVFFVHNVQAAHRAVIGKNLFVREDVVVMAD